MTDTATLRNALSRVQRGLSVAKLGLARDGVQHGKIVQMEEIVAAALDIPSLPTCVSILEDAIAFIESLTAVPLLMGDDIEMRLEDVQAHAKVEAASLRKRAAKEGGEAGAILRAALQEYGLDENVLSEGEKMGRHAAVRGMMVRLGLYPVFCDLLAKDTTDDEIVAALPEATAAPATQPGEAVREAAQSVINSATNTYRKRNGQTGTIEGEDGEMSWIVPFDPFEQLRAALSVPSPAGEAGEPAPETNGMGGDAVRDTIVAMRDKHGNANGTGYEQGVWDQSQRILWKLAYPATPSPQPADAVREVDEAAEREAFAKWWPKHWPNAGSVSDNVWQGWMGRAALAPPETAEAVPVAGRSIRDAFEDWAVTDHRAIEPLPGEDRDDENGNYYADDVDNACFIGWREHHLAARSASREATR